MTLTADHAARLAEVRRARANGVQLEPSARKPHARRTQPTKPKKLPRTRRSTPKIEYIDGPFGYVVIRGTFRIAGPFRHRWLANSKAADIEGAEVRRVLT